jgi:hypothetical protein
MTIGHVIYKLDPTLSPVRHTWSLTAANRRMVDNRKGR